MTLWGRRTSSVGWEFATGRDESTMADFLSEDDEDLIPLLVREPEDWVTSLEEGMSLFDQYSWWRLYPNEIHPIFRTAVWNQVMTKRLPSRALFRWASACEAEVDPVIVTLAEWILKSQRMVVLSGAGLSVASGLADFRSPSGWWNNIDPTKVASLEALENTYDLFNDFYSYRICQLKGLEPNVGHRVLAKWENQGLVHAVVTQNVDGFHQMAGSQNVFELHGSIRTIRCAVCERPGTVDDFLEKLCCSKCGGKLRPNVVLFDEMLPERAWEEALKAIEEAELVLVLGSSLNVYPANTLPSMTNGRTAAINLEPTRLDDQFDLVIHGRLENILPEIHKWTGISGS